MIETFSMKYEEKYVDCTGINHNNGFLRVLFPLKALKLNNRSVG